MLRLPAPGSDLRATFDVRDLADWRALSTFPRALAAARQSVTAEVAATAVHFIALRADGQVWLCRVGKRGGWKRVWNFGNPLLGPEQFA